MKRAIAALVASAWACASLLAQPSPLVQAGKPATWWFVFKFNATALDCGARACPFGGTVQTYKDGQRFAYASSISPSLQDGGGCVGDSKADPVGATFDAIYNGHLFYVVWNDQFGGDPIATKDAPYGHSKGVLAWDKNGDGLVMQVSTPSWPGSGSAAHPRTDGNSLGCVKDDDVLVSQHFFALRLTHADTLMVLRALQNASVVTDPSKPQIANSGGPEDVQAAVSGLGKTSKSAVSLSAKLSSGVTLISKPSGLHVPPWQMVSAWLGQPLRVASWWAAPKIPSTATSTPVKCWDPALGSPSGVDIATTGTWDGKSIGLMGTASPSGNHAKIGVSTSAEPYVIFGDENQQGSLNGPNCGSSQNGRGGLFFVVYQTQLHSSVVALLKGDSAAR